MVSAPPTSLKIHPSLLIASIGNPSPYFNTLHSAGHHLLARLAVLLTAPPLRPDIHFGRASYSLTTHPDDESVNWTLWQSPVQMNASGRPVKKAWSTFTALRKERDSAMGVPRRKKRLVVLHDELELPLGEMRFKGGLQGDEYEYDDRIRKRVVSIGGDGNGGSGKGGIVASARGHNGVKSVLDPFSRRERPNEISKTSIIRVGVGIDRPASRDASDVSNYVLKTMSERERSLVEGAAEQVLERLKALKVQAHVQAQSEKAAEE